MRDNRLRFAEPMARNARFDRSRRADRSLDGTGKPGHGQRGTDQMDRQQTASVWREETFHENHKVEPLLLGPVLYVRVHTDSGHCRDRRVWNLGSVEGLGGVDRQIRRLSLVGKDPFPIEHHWNVMLRANHFTGGADHRPRSQRSTSRCGISKAVLQCSGFMSCSAARFRHKARLYGHVKGRTIEKLVEEAVRLERGRVYRAWPFESTAG